MQQDFVLHLMSHPMEKEAPAFQDYFVKSKQAQILEVFFLS
jgi:hypothetical protein